jgi:hypothetical protein
LKPDECGDVARTILRLAEIHVTSR